MYRYFKRVAVVGSGNHVYFWKSTTTDYSLNPKLSYYGTKTGLEFSGSCLKQDTATYDHGTMVNINIFHK